MKKQWKRLAALSSAAVMAAGTLLYFPTDTLQNISWGITASAEETGEGTESGSQTWKEDNLIWTLTADGTMTISGSGAMKGYSWYSGSPATQKKDIVKKVVIQEGVTSIGNSAFYNCSNLKSIEIPEGVTSIGAFAFYNCGGLTSIEIPETVKNIGKGAFAGCGGLTSLEIPSGVTSIGDNTFSGCSSLTDITIPDSVTSIGNSAFSGCSSLTDITIPDSVTSIGNSAFSGCSSLTDITIPESVTNIEDSAFEYCSSLTGITIPESVTSIERYAFRNCTGLKSITIPKSVESVGDEAFSGCTALTEVLLEGGSTLTSESFGEVADKVVTRWNEDSLIWTLVADGTMTISGTGTMKDYSWRASSPATQKKENVKKVVIEDGVTSIGDFAFFMCSNLTSITIPSSVANIGSGVFYSCNNLTEVLLENGSKLTSERLGVNESQIATYWSEGDLTWTLTADGTLTISGKGAMKDYFHDSPATQKKDIVKKVVIEEGVTSIGDYAFFGYSSLTSIEIPESVTSIGIYAFCDCSSLTDITIPGSVTSIGDSTFSNCTGLTSITIPEGVTSIGGSALYGCTSLTSIEIPSGVTIIRDRAFYNCTSLTSITIPKSVKSIGNNAFSGCTTLKEVLLEGGSTLTSESFGKVADKVVTRWNEGKLTWTLTADGTMTISGKGAMKDYNNSTDISPATQKKDNVNKVVIEDGVTSIGNLAFFMCSNLTSITIPSSVANIGSGVFYSCDNLTEVLLENGSKLTSESLGVDASKIRNYWNEDNLTWTLTADGTLTISGKGAMKDYFHDSPATQKKDIVKKVVIEEGVTSIGMYAFFGYSSLTSIEIPESVTSIGIYAFCDCSSLTDITIPGSVTSIGDSTFSNCTGLTSITIPKSVISIGTDAFYGCDDSLEITVPCDSTLTKDAFDNASEKVKHRHSLVKTDAKDATYTEAGNVEYWTCENCKKHFLTNETAVEAAKEVELSEIVKPVPVQVATATTQIKCVYGQDMDEINLQDYVKNANAVGEVSVKVATGSTMLDGMQLDGSKLSGKPAKAYTDGKDVTFTFTAKNGNTANLTLNFLVAKADPTVKVTVDGDTHTEGDLVSELKLILSGNNTKGAAKIVSKLKKLIAGENTLTWEFTPEDSENYNVVTGTVVVNAQTTTATTKAATTATSGTTSATKATTVTSGTTATTKATATTNETTATIEETTTKNETTATTEETTATSETTVTTEETTITNETTVTTEETTTNETTATTEATTATSETTATTEATTVTTNETTATTEATTAINETTATTATNGTTSATKATTTTTNGTTSATQTTTTTKESTTASEATMTTSASNTESTATTSATTITTAVTTSVTNIADEDLCSWALNDYLKKTGVIAVNAEITARSENAYEITLTDENGNVLDVYTIDPKTGTGTDSSNAEVNLPQTGNNSMTNWLLCVGAAMFMAFGFGAVKASGIRKRKEDE